MKSGVIALILAATMMVAGTVSAQDETSDLLARVNALRASLGLAAYTLNGTLGAAAQSQAQWMVDTGQISHSHPDGSTPRSRALAAGYSSSWVSENIYGGTYATVNDAWNFWINSDIHYRGLTNPNYRDVGIGVGHGAWGSTYVMVFGDPGGPPPFQQASSAGNGAPQQPSFVVGVDAHGNIMHEVQPGDTLGDIALIYGYTWDEIPYMMQLNGLTNPRELEVGSILLVPPYDGTYTPTPGESAPQATPEAAQPAPVRATPEDAPSPADDLGILTTGTAISPDRIPGATPTTQVYPMGTAETALVVAAVPTAVTPATAATTEGGMITRSGPSPWLTIALVVQAAVLLVAGVEFVLRGRRRR